MSEDWGNIFLFFCLMNENSWQFPNMAWGVCIGRGTKRPGTRRHRSLGGKGVI